jgi:hypothetical protein
LTFDLFGFWPIIICKNIVKILHNNDMAEVQTLNSWKTNTMWQQSWLPNNVLSPTMLIVLEFAPTIPFDEISSQAMVFFVLLTIYIMLGELLWHKLQIDNKMQVDHIWLCRALSYLGLSYEMQWNYSSSLLA